ncbi:MAG: SIMPL domain-containing protein [Gammaproteobacteria bacterium]|nr:SIMPL domain-containing protein [Gammaproteobacteria bacterium]
MAGAAVLAARALLRAALEPPALVLLFLAALSASALADDEAADAYDRVHLSFTASDDVANDVVVAVMFLQRDGENASALADEVNRVMRRAVESALKTPAVRAQTLQYQAMPVYRNNKLAGWRVRQALRLESSDTDALSALMGELQDKLSVQSVDYLLSAQSRQAAEERLIAEALAGFRNRADLVAGELGRPGYRIVRLDVDTQHGGPRPLGLARSAMMAAEAAPPTLEAGVQNVRVDVRGTVELRIE